MASVIVIQWLGGLLAVSILTILLVGIWRTDQRAAGRAVGRWGRWMLSRRVSLAATVLFGALSWLAWRPLGLRVEPAMRLWILALGVLLYVPGLLFVLWGRLALGRNYAVATAFGARLFEGHQLITHGPYAIVRHPMYAGLLLAAWGSLMIYFTWTTACYAVLAPLVLLRARREEAALAAEFGERWQAYRRRVPAFIPRVPRRH